jgi:hypothetical protein
VLCAWSIRLRLLFLLWICSSHLAFWAAQVIFVFPPAHLPAQLPPKALLFSLPDFVCRSARSVLSLGVSSGLCRVLTGFSPLFFLLSVDFSVCAALVSASSVLSSFWISATRFCNDSRSFLSVASAAATFIRAFLASVFVCRQIRWPAPAPVYASSSGFASGIFRFGCSSVCVFFSARCQIFDRSSVFGL